MTQKTRFTVDTASVTDICNLARQAMLAEVNLSPKPGLVDRYDCGAHKDMSLTDFHRSAQAIRLWLPHFVESGVLSAALPESKVLTELRPIGLACETEMFRATAGVNTHKGTIFSLGLICAAMGRLLQNKQPVTPDKIGKTIAAFCQGLTARELKKPNHQQTAGQRLYRQLGMTGARGEAEAGYPLVLNLALPHYRSRLAAGTDPELALLDTLLVLMAHNNDTNVASRGGVAGLNWLQQHAKTLLALGGIQKAADLRHLHEFNQMCIERNLSPGGSADLLIATWFLNETTHLTLSPKSIINPSWRISYVCFKR